METKMFRHISGAAWGVLLLVPSEGQASDFYDEAWELRFAVSMDRQSNYPSTLGRHASVAFPGGTSRNPAADDWQVAGRGTHSVSLALVEAPSQSGALIQAIIGATSFRAADVPGTWSLAFARTDTPDSTARQGFHDAVESNEFFLGYSRRLSDTLSWGIQGRLLNADLLRESAMAELGGLPGRVKTALEGADVEIGLLGETRSAWTWGLVAGFGVSGASSDIFNITLLPGQLFPVPPGTLLESRSDDIASSTMRLGVGRQWEGGGVYSDLHYIELRTDLSGSVAMGRLSLGFEQSVSAAWTVRGGATIDTIHQWSFGTGASYRGRKSVVEFGYQYNAAPELEPELGRVHLISLSAAWAL